MLECFGLQEGNALAGAQLTSKWWQYKPTSYVPYVALAVPHSSLDAPSFDSDQSYETQPRELPLKAQYAS